MQSLVIKRPRSSRLLVRVPLLAGTGMLLPPMVAVVVGALILLTAWTTPPTFTPLQNITASILNTYLRDNLLHLKENLPQPGEIGWWPTATAPTGYLFCNGQAVSRTTYADLFTAIGTAFGAGDGTTTFNLPDARGRSPLGVDGTHALGSTGGSENATLTTDNIPSHNHSMPTHAHGIAYIGVSVEAGGSEFPSLNLGGGGFTVETDGGNGGFTSNVGNGTAFSIRNPYLTLNMIIKY